MDENASKLLQDDRVSAEALYSILCGRDQRQEDWGPITGFYHLAEYVAFVAWDTRQPPPDTNPNRYQFSCWIPTSILKQAVVRVASERIGVVFANERLRDRLDTTTPWAPTKAVLLDLPVAKVTFVGEGVVSIEWKWDGQDERVEMPIRVLAGCFRGVGAPSEPSEPSEPEQPEDDEDPILVSAAGPWRIVRDRATGKPLGGLTQIAFNFDIIQEVMSRVARERANRRGRRA